jgi:hypothetical protein
MSAPAAPSESQKANPSLSIGQMVQLMQLEVDRALAHEYPLSAMMIGLDGFTREQDLTLRRRLMPALFGLLKVVTFESGIRGLGLTQDYFVLAVFPHTSPDRTRELANAIIERAATLEVEGLPEGAQVRVSIGIGHNQRPGEMSFAVLVEETEMGARQARREGGGRCVLGRRVESELESLRVELEEEIRTIAKQSQAFSQQRLGEGQRWGREMIENALALFDTVKEPPAALVRMKREVVALMTHEVDRLLKSPVFHTLSEKEKQIDLLERRVRKLTEHLDLTEAELKRVAKMKVLDDGVSSLYRTVQGLTQEDEQAGQKQGMLQVIFEANLAMQAAAK